MILQNPKINNGILLTLFHPSLKKCKHTFIRCYFYWKIPARKNRRITCIWYRTQCDFMSWKQTFKWEGYEMVVLEIHRFLTQIRRRKKISLFGLLYKVTMNGRSYILSFSPSLLEISREGWIILGWFSMG